MKIIKSLLIIQLSVFSIVSLAQSKDKDTLYIRKAVEFINEAERYYLDSNFIINKIVLDIDTNCINELIKDTHNFSKRELRSIRTKNTHIQYWTNKEFPKHKIFNYDSLWVVHKDNFVQVAREFDKLYKHKKIVSFSMPLFFRNYTYCIIYIKDGCGINCGSRRLVAYKKNGKKWKRVKTYCEWFS